MAGRYAFTRLTADELPLVHRWLAAPHVSEWWPDGGDEIAQVVAECDGEQAETVPYLVHLQDRPFAYLQCYEQAAWPENGLGGHPTGTRGIDQFIGEAHMVNRGHGSAFIRAFIDDLIAAGAPRVITDPDPANARAIRAYEKAGFVRDHEVDTPDGRALLMVRDA